MKTLLISLAILFALSSTVYAGNSHRYDREHSNHNSRHYSSYGKHNAKHHYYNNHYGKHGSHGKHYAKHTVYYSSRPGRHHNDHIPAIIIGAGVIGYILGSNY